MNYEKLTHEEEIELILAGQAGDLEARNRVIMTVQALAYHVSYRMMRKSHEGLIHRHDMVHSALALVCERFHEFDVNRNTRFVTWALWWIRRGCQVYAAQAMHRGVKIPTFWTTEKDAMPQTVYLSEIERTTDSAWHDIQAEHRPEAHQEHADAEEKEAMLAAVRYYLEKLGSRTAHIVLSHYSGETYRSIAKRLNLSKQRIRQLLVRGIGQLKELLTEDGQELAQARRERLQEASRRTGRAIKPRLIPLRDTYQLTEQRGGTLADAIDYLTEKQ